MGGQVYSYQSCLQCPNLEREGRGRTWFSVLGANCPASLSLHCCMTVGSNSTYVVGGLRKIK